MKKIQILFRGKQEEIILDGWYRNQSGESYISWQFIDSCFFNLTLSTSEEISLLEELPLLCANLNLVYDLDG